MKRIHLKMDKGDICPLWNETVGPHICEGCLHHGTIWQTIKKGEQLKYTVRCYYAERLEEEKSGEEEVK